MGTRLWARWGAGSVAAAMMLWVVGAAAAPPKLPPGATQDAADFARRAWQWITDGATVAAPKQPPIWEGVSPSQPANLLRELTTSGALSQLGPPPAPAVYRAGIWTPRLGVPWLEIAGCAVYVGQSELVSGPNRIVWTGTANTNGEAGHFEMVLTVLDVSLTARQGGIYAVQAQQKIKRMQEQVRQAAIARGGAVTFEEWAIITAFYLIENSMGLSGCHQSLKGLLGRA